MRGACGRERSAKRTDLDYIGDDLEALAGLANYRSWILSEFTPYLRGRVVEIGAGIGSFSLGILDFAARLELIEPAPQLFAELRRKFGDREHVAVRQLTAEQWAAETPAGGCDAVVMINVLEHIEQDRAVAERIFQALAPGGHFLVFVPALMALMSNLDRKYGHFRRYTRDGLAAMLAEVGFEVGRAQYFDALGMLPWLIVNTWLGQTRINPRLAALYDAVGVPLTRGLERIVAPPAGKNVIAIARKP